MFLLPSQSISIWHTLVALSVYETEIFWVQNLRKLLQAPDLIQYVSIRLEHLHKHLLGFLNLLQSSTKTSANKWILFRMVSKTYIIFLQPVTQSNWSMEFLWEMRLICKCSCTRNTKFSRQRVLSVCSLWEIRVFKYCGLTNMNLAFNPCL